MWSRGCCAVSRLLGELGLRHRRRQAAACIAWRAAGPSQAEDTASGHGNRSRLPRAEPALPVFRCCEAGLWDKDELDARGAAGSGRLDTSAVFNSPRTLADFASSCTARHARPINHQRRQGQDSRCVAADGGGCEAGVQLPRALRSFRFFLLPSRASLSRLRVRGVR